MALQGEWRVCSFGELPEWMKDNNNLLDYHRPPMPSFSRCFKSIFRIHTETLNIWIHLVGFLFYLCQALFFFSKPMVPLETKVVFGIFFASILFCLSMSCLYHTLNCHSSEVKNLFHKMDHCGYFVLFTGSCLAWIYYTFHITAYVSLVGLIGKCLMLVVSLWNFPSDPKLLFHRLLLLFFAFVLGAVLPKLNFSMDGRLKYPLYMKSINILYLSEAYYLFGGMLNVCRFPEILWPPGTCDLIPQSHQLFHIFILAASYIDYCAIYSIAFSA